MKIGERVIAIQDSDDTEIRYFGFGVYAGEFVPDSAVGPLAEALCSEEIPNPRIDLDGGGHVWGCECWWGAEKPTREKYKDLKWVLVSIDNLRTRV